MLRRSTALGLTLALAACAGREATRRLTVVVDVGAAASVCEDPGGIDLKGVDVSVADREGNVLAQAALGAGQPPTGPPASLVAVCRFEAVVEVPDRPPFAVTVDRGPPVTYTRRDLEQFRWIVSYPAWELPALAPAG
ncbi:hypothetical protein HRbin12_00282 [bacterium HR12]|nr:hypothetical protein HRbin12_00282 [bacterium HR12]